MAFRLKKVINGEEKVFLIQKFLEILGEPTNDEIQIDGEAYRISSFIALDGGSGIGQITIWQSMELSIIENSQNLFTLSESITDIASVQLYVNGIFYKYGNQESYHIQGGNLYWHGDFNLEITDYIYLKYSKAI